MKLKKFEKKLAEIKAALIYEDTDDLLERLASFKSIEDLSKDRDIINEFKALTKEDAEKLLDEFFDRSMNGDKQDPIQKQIFFYLKEINEKRQD